MPAQSRAQQKALFAKYGEEWVRRHHFDRIKHLRKRRKKRKK